MEKKQTTPEKIWQFFCSVKLSVVTLILLAVTSIVGTIILQNGNEREYLKLYGEFFYKLIKLFQFDDMYGAWWFLALIVLLCINIVVCSIERLSITWKIIFPKKIKFNINRFRKQKNLIDFKVKKPVSDLVPACELFLTRNVGKVISEKTGDSTVLYAEKGRWTRIGVYIVHLSILLMLGGALIGMLFGFKAGLNLDEGKYADQAFVFKTKKMVNLGFSIQCNKFDVTFYDTGAPEEFVSNLTIIEDGKASFTKDIRVNHPLRYKGINIFQSSYGTASPDTAVIGVVNRADNKTEVKSVKIGEEITLPDGKGVFKLEGFLPHFDFRGHNLGETFVGHLIREGEEPLQIGLPIKFPMFDKMRKGTYAFVIKSFPKKYYTGLQITKDPGVWYVYAGFILMIAGCWVTFFMSHDSIMIEVESKSSKNAKISISGTTNRNQQGLKLKLKRYADKLKED